MCGRFVRITPIPVIAEKFKARQLFADLAPSYNIAPSQEIVIINDEGVRQLVQCTWGFVPSSAKDPSIGNEMINARSETVLEKPAFRSAFKKHRCLVVADGFYEWRTGGKRCHIKSGILGREVRMNGTRVLGVFATKELCWDVDAGAGYIKVSVTKTGTSRALLNGVYYIPGNPHIIFVAGTMEKKTRTDGTIVASLHGTQLVDTELSLWALFLEIDPVTKNGTCYHRDVLTGSSVTYEMINIQCSAAPPY